MTEENKYEQITKMLRELQCECEKTGLSLIFQASDNKGTTMSGLVGSIVSAGRNLTILEETLEEQLEVPVKVMKMLGAVEPCECPECKAKQEGESEEDDKPSNILEAIMGLFESVLGDDEEGESDDNEDK